MNTSPLSCVLFAAGFDWLEALLPFLFVLFWIVSQVFAVFRRLQGGGGKPMPLPQEQRRLPRLPAGDAQAPRSELEKQIADFLRDATGEPRRLPEAGEARLPDVRPAQRVAPPTSTPATKTIVRKAAAPMPPQSGRLTAPAAPQRRAPQGRLAQRDSVEKQPSPVARERDRTPLSQQATPDRPVGPLSTGETDVSRHVHDAFSRELTHLQGGLAHDEAAAAPASAAATQAAHLVQLLRSPATIRQVILLREVLDRPVDRW